MIKKPSLFIYEVSYVQSYQFSEKAVREHIKQLGLPEPNEITIKNIERYRYTPLGNDMIRYMVYVDWKLNNNT